MSMAPMQRYVWGGKPSNCFLLYYISLEAVSLQVLGSGKAASSPKVISECSVSCSRDGTPSLSSLGGLIKVETVGPIHDIT